VRNTNKYSFNLTIIYCVVYSSLSFAQSHSIDSLFRVLQTEKEDTNRVNTLNMLTSKLFKVSKYDTALICANTTKGLAEKLGYKKGLATALLNIGVAYDYLGKYPTAMEFEFKALAVAKEVKDKMGESRVLGDIGELYGEQGDFTKALEWEMKALDADKEIGLNHSISADYGNIGIIYDILGDHLRGLDYEFKALEIDKKIGDESGIASAYGNIALFYKETANYPKALEYVNMGLTMEREAGDMYGVATKMGTLGSIYMKQKQYTLARIYGDSALYISKRIREKDIIALAYSNLAVLDSATGDFKAALNDYKTAILYHDSLVNEANTKKTVQTEMNFEFAQKQATAKAEQDKKDAIAMQDKNKQKVIRNSFIAGFALMLALAFFIFRGYRQKQKANEIITQQKEEVEKQKTLVEHQKALVEEKNRDILDSITYAKRLQDAILPPLSIINQYLPQSFVLYKPKDIVAGDFYWLERTADTILIAAADCTGHGVPGALVSVVCSNALNRTVKEFGITEPGKILDKVRELVLETFEKSEDNVQDGMDISLCCLNTQTLEIQWSGANNSLWYIQNKELKEVEPNKQPIGKYYNATAFNTHKLNLQKGDALYLFTDGYADQFGGEKGKKFKYKQMQQLIVNNTQLTMAQQKELLNKEFEGWKGNLEQVDDVLVIGIRI
jgi:serine phosphatase RsbU (regulator of sigma subunit)